MDSRQKILCAVKSSKAASKTSVEEYHLNVGSDVDTKQQFKDMLERVGGSYLEVAETNMLSELIINLFPTHKEIVYAIPDLLPQLAQNQLGNYGDVTVTVLKGNFAVAENGAIWVSDKNMPERVLPFICEHLVLVIQEADLVATMHDAYQKIDSSDYEFGTFIAGPSKTADIEQTLVFGAHGPKTLTVFSLSTDALPTYSEVRSVR
jgi:L-lactate dehydrogenase complex protein LldG